MQSWMHSHNIFNYLSAVFSVRGNKKTGVNYMFVMANSFQKACNSIIIAYAKKVVIFWKKNIRIYTD